MGACEGDDSGDAAVMNRRGFLLYTSVTDALRWLQRSSGCSYECWGDHNGIKRSPAPEIEVLGRTIVSVMCSRQICVFFGFWLDKSRSSVTMTDMHGGSAGLSGRDGRPPG